MAIEIDPQVAAYGLFQVAFASLETRLSRSLLRLRECRTAKYTLVHLMRMPFRKKLRMLRQAIKAVSAGAGTDPNIEELTRACLLAKSVGKWRNERIHGEVRFAENRPVILDRKGNPLQIDYGTCEAKIREAIRAAIGIETGVAHVAAFEMDIDDLMV